MPPITLTAHSPSHKAVERAFAVSKRRVTDPLIQNALPFRREKHASGRSRRVRQVPAVMATSSAVDSVIEAVPDFLLTTNPATFAIETAAAAVLAGGASIWTRRPLGSSCSAIEVRESSIHGSGVFATTSIPAGTWLGVYPGVPRSPQEMVAKVAYAPGAKDYCFVSEAGIVLDPTDAGGVVTERPDPLWPVPIDTTLARVNEPPLGRSVNVESETVDGRRRVDFLAIRDIMAGEELFIDYGANYDRSRYNTDNSEQQSD